VGCDRSALAVVAYGDVAQTTVEVEFPMEKRAKGCRHGLFLSGWNVGKRRERHVWNITASAGGAHDVAFMEWSKDKQSFVAMSLESSRFNQRFQVRSFGRTKHSVIRESVEQGDLLLSSPRRQTLGFHVRLVILLLFFRPSNIKPHGTLPYPNPSPWFKVFLGTQIKSSGSNRMSWFIPSKLLT